MDHLYERIRDARERAGLSVNEAADKLGVSRVQVWRMENKAETISAERLFVIAAIYQVDPYQLFHGTKATACSQTGIYRRIGEVVSMVEGEAQKLDVKPPPHLVGEAVIEVLRQENGTSTTPNNEPLDATKYRGFVALLFKQATNS
ncbi:helix-turn-helix domain-containing protein [Pseudooctadecabacter jejudonensis]|uniref:Helix-turn-helix domain protein n=1 Tax=Pseudooctadecabacter jejudonensis TaxID=1391910 RepID=A0A1Y5TGT6_9RHOB|nr:helix-turn-helix transcriptional regulator [Pseudooctadecabacter jejudonensis]SLN63860.1 Helix-turn-helix domain protein [Pseudooctadecabacter jejudonensis]